MSSETSLIIDAAIAWVDSIESHPNNWADDKELELIRSVEYYMDRDTWGLFNE